MLQTFIAILGKRAQNLEVRGGAVGARHRRDQQIVSVYGPSVAAKKPKPSAAARPPKPDDYLEKVRVIHYDIQKILYY